MKYKEKYLSDLSTHLFIYQISESVLHSGTIPFSSPTSVNKRDNKDLTLSMRGATNIHRKYVESGKRWLKCEGSKQRAERRVGCWGFDWRKRLLLIWVIQRGLNKYMTSEQRLKGSKGGI